jgi:putative endonuclease
MKKRNPMPDKISDKLSSERPTRKRLGTRGEQLVAQHLTRQGWRILTTNFRCVRGEIDVIAEETTDAGKVLVFIEVKTRHGQMYGTPSEAVDARKQQKLFAVAQAYLGTLQAGGEEPACRFDVAEVRVDGSDYSVIELRRAFFIGE